MIASKKFRVRARIFSLLGLLAAFTASSALAGGADGFYKATSLSGTVRVAGKEVKLPLRELRNALLKNGVVVVRDNRIPVRTARWGEVLEELNLFGIDGNASVSGPDRIVLRKNSRGFAGTANRTLNVSLKGRYKRLPAKVTMRTSLRTKVIGDILKIDTPVEFRVIGLKLNGRITLEAKRMEVPPLRPN